MLNIGIYSFKFWFVCIISQISANYNQWRTRLRLVWCICYANVMQKTSLSVMRWVPNPHARRHITRQSRHHCTKCASRSADKVGLERITQKTHLCLGRQRCVFLLVETEGLEPATSAMWTQIIINKNAYNTHFVWFLYLHTTCILKNKPHHRQRKLIQWR